MAKRSSSSSAMIQPVCCPEDQPLLHSPLPVLSIRERLGQACILPRHVCPPSKAALLIMVWSAIVGTTYIISIDSIIAVGVASKTIEVNGQKRHLNIFINILVPYTCLALVLLLYPLSGFVADICCGRFKTVVGSLCVLVCSFGFFTFCCTLFMINIEHGNQVPQGIHNFFKYFLLIVAIVAFLLFVVGLSGFQANFIQLGLEQLHEAPSEYLGLFVHWAVWASIVMTPILHITFASYACYQGSGLLYGILSLPCICFLVLSFVLLFSCRKKDWFYSEPGQHNPYTTVIKVLHFARKHKYPLRRSAFTYCGSQRPTRIDLAKERYGGPFTTEQVEDVKSFLRILVILLTLGPIFLLEVPMSNFVFQSFALHIGYGPEFKTKNCTPRWLVLESGTMGHLLSTFTFPVYIWLMYSFLRRCIPRIFIRLFFGECLLFMGVLSMSLIDILGHHMLDINNQSIPSYYQNNTESYCMFKLYSTHKHVNKTLRLHWGSNVIPNLFIGLGPAIIIATAFEFISAQSPHSMKGLLVGVLFATRGLFQLSSAVLLLPFSIPEMWSQGQFVSDPKAINCGFGYLFIICALALMGLILFAVMAKQYKYRERDDPPFNQAIVEEVFAKNVCHNAYQVHSPEDARFNINADI